MSDTYNRLRLSLQASSLSGKVLLASLLLFQGNMPFCTPEEFSERYYQPDDITEKHLGRGGASTGVERLFARETGQQFAVKRLSLLHHIDFPFLLENEIDGLVSANYYSIPRVVKFVEVLILPDCESLVILELVQGISLNKPLSDLYFPDIQIPAPDLQQHEQQVMEVAAQMLQTVHLLHRVSGMAHLDITSSNIMLRKEGYQPWDQLRLLDFGFAQDCSKDPKVLDVVPQGATAAYAAPEVLRSLQLQFEWAHDSETGVRINGPSADFWAVGMVLYELLTGEVPFDGKDSSVVTEAPTDVPSKSKDQWEDYESVLDLQRSWVQACELAKNCHSKVQHPLLDKVRQCSANPEQVARFFEEILSPIPHVRVEAISQAWCADAVTQMFTESGTSYDSSATEADLQTEAGLCTTLFGCFACGSPQRRRRRCSMQPSNRVAKLASKLDFFKRPRGKPSAPSKPCSSEAKALQADSKQAANVSSKKGCLSWVKNGYCTFRSRSKQPSPHVAEQLAPPSATELRLLMDVDSTSAASYTPSRPGHSSSAAAGLSSTGDRLEAPAVSMTAVAGVDLRPQLQQQPVHNQTGAHETTQNKPQPCLRVPGIGDDQLTHDAAGGETGRNVLAKDDLKKSAVGVDRGVTRCHRTRGFFQKGKDLWKRLHLGGLSA